MRIIHLFFFAGVLGQAELFRSLGKALRDMGATQRHPFKRSGPIVNKFAAYVDECVNKAFALSGLGTGLDDLMTFIKSCEQEAMDEFFN
ncbi:Oidioi.mRNA.OKI2018_I69.chr1.g1919.t1.cds [Oikopleura dioica]|uniref:Oidioi.mRNA.OKI2018_I69.chr1.g1919.t1.cds n=1 Tax=Oikopleura dioica TaxID=34765 RepID=A0ABN7SPG4_OIKDI|nr:Oidioi.mRNA.OKI2018_I69.chr1.g1919.t1.cds [Oikopleura dioica]